MAEFETLNIYDSPEVVLSMLLDEEATAIGGWRALFEPNKLSPAERDTFVTRLKKEYGGDPLGNAMVNIFTNPAVWFLLATSPPGFNAIVKTGKLFQTAAKFTPGFREHGPLLGLWGMLTGAQFARGTPLVPVAQQIERIRGAIYQEVFDDVAEPASRLIRRHGLSEEIKLRSEGYVSPVKRELSTRLEQDLGAYLNGMHVDHPEFHVTLQGSKAVVMQTNVPTLLPGRGAQNLVASMKANDLLDYAESIKRSTRKVADRVLGDEQGAMRVYRAWARPAHSTPALGDAEEAAAQMGSEILQSIASDLPEMVRSGALGPEEFVGVVRSLRETIQKNEWYYPRNLWRVVRGADGGGVRDVLPEELGAKGAFGALKGSGRVVPRDRFTQDVPFDPEDLEALAGRYGASETMEKMIEQGRGIIRDLGEDRAKAPFRFVKLRGEEAFSRYVDQMVDSAIVGAAPDAAVLAAQNRRAKEIAAGMQRGEVNVQGSLDAFHQPGLGAAAREKGQRAVKGVPIESAMDEVDEGLRPAGGWSLNDVLYAEGATWKQSSKDREVFTSTLVPLLMGKGTPHRGVLVAMNEKIKGAAPHVADFLESAVGETEMGSNVVASMRNWAALPSAGVGTIGLGSRTASYLYNTHLGLNMGSVINQTLQPFTHGSMMFGGTNTVALGVKEAWQDLFTYAKKRLDLVRTTGAVRIDEATRSKLAKESFRLLEAADGEDITNVLKPVTDAVEGLVVGTGRAPTDVPSLGRFLTFDLPMKLFEKAEWSNRLTTAYTVAGAYRQRASKLLGRQATWREALAPAGAKETVKQAVAEYQFHSDSMNTPLMFQTWLKSPLLRQFLSFQARSLASFVEAGKLGGGRYLSPLLGGGKIPGSDVPLVANLVDFGRLMGVGAIFYEGAKGLMGADISRALGVSAVTDILPFVEGGQYNSDSGLLPIPPAVDIGTEVVKSVFEGDLGTLGQQFWRLIPSGVALQRAAGVLADVPALPQKTYADWGSKGADGRVPLYKEDGTLIDYRTPTELLLKGLGVDLGAFKQGTDLDKYLIRIREEANSYRQRYTRAVMTGEHGKAEALKDEFQRRFQVPLTVTKQQMKAAQEGASVPRTERLLKGTPPVIRGQLDALVQGQAGRVGREPEGVQGGEPEEGAFSGFQGFGTFN